MGRYVMRNGDDQMVRCCEFFSGIGGMRAALRVACQTIQVPFTIVQAYDVNEHANAAYEANYGHRPSNRSIANLTVDELDALSATIWLMSPPCQPFTHGGLSLDDADTRTSPLVHLTEILQRIKSPPQFILLENVPHFETSNTHALLLAALKSRDYQTQEFMLSPIQLGYPNERLRYFLLASQSANFPTTTLSTQCPPVNAIVRFKLEEALQAPLRRQPIGQAPHLCAHCQWSSATVPEKPFSDIRPLHEYLLPEPDPALVIPPDLFNRRPTFRFDLVVGCSKRSSCFTKGYGSSYKGTGSMLQINQEDQPVGLATGEQIVQRNLAARYFSPQELLRLHGFPPHFEWPHELSTVQRWKLVGNSLSVPVVAVLLVHGLIASDPSPCPPLPQIDPQPSPAGNRHAS
eukprot:NODE_571_length_1345_cov_148.524691_g445_i0.p1 GENE.NODE_571_length_1345_cov_148.524691_g445_i0~~NODE_571_length_1345_cov_148.524691_g445_i0.p1  ORF type:complete len:412 (-),score=37.46 NODE_571_length_1345_cov_148.524691_g445_i0:108-1319(-)